MKLPPCPWLWRIPASISIATRKIFPPFKRCGVGEPWRNNFLTDPPGALCAWRERDQLWNWQGVSAARFPRSEIGGERDLEEMAGGEEGNGAGKKQQLQHRVGKKKGGPPPGPQAEPTILREGEADILLHGNDVFYNKAQVKFFRQPLHCYG